MKGLHPAWKTNEDWDPEKSEGGGGTMGRDDGDNKFPGIALTIMRKA